MLPNQPKNLVKTLMWQENNNRMKKLIIIISLFSVTSCTQILDNFAEQNVVGLWHLSTVKDVASGKVTDIAEFDVTNSMIGQKGTAINFSDESFDIFFQLYGEDGTDGTYEVDVLQLTLTYDDGTELVRSIVSAGESELVLEDTIGNKAKLLTFIKQ